MIELRGDPGVRIATQLSAKIEMCWQSTWGPELERRGVAALQVHEQSRAGSKPGGAEVVTDEKL